MLADKNLKEFLEETASNSPVPGGGSVAAVSASFSAALAEMVSNLTIGKKKYQDVEDEMKKLRVELEKYRNKFIEDIDRDADSFGSVMESFKLPKETEEEIKVRKSAIQEGLKEAAKVPLEIAKDAFEMMDLIAEIVDKGNKSAVTDGAVAAMMARTAVLSALYNVKINLASIKDEEFVSKIGKEVQELESKVEVLEKDILSRVKL